MNLCNVVSENTFHFILSERHGSLVPIRFRHFTNSPCGTLSTYFVVNTYRTDKLLKLILGESQ